MMQRAHRPRTLLVGLGLCVASLCVLPACSSDSDSSNPNGSASAGTGGMGTAGAATAGSGNASTEPLYGDVGEGEPCEGYRDCQQGLTCNREGAVRLCRDPLLERPYCYSATALGGADEQGCFCSVGTGVSSQLEYGCAGTFEKSGDPLCCADAAWPDADHCVCRTYDWVCGGDSEDCFCVWTFVLSADDDTYPLPPAMCRQRAGQTCCNGDAFCSCNDYQGECGPNETQVTSCATPMGAPACSDDETTVTECKSGPPPPDKLPTPDPEPPKPSQPSQPCDPEVCNGSMGSCAGDYCFFCSWACRPSGCESSCSG